MACFSNYLCEGPVSKNLSYNSLGCKGVRPMLWGKQIFKLLSCQIRSKN